MVFANTTNFTLKRDIVTQLLFSHSPEDGVTEFLMPHGRARCDASLEARVLVVIKGLLISTYLS